MASPRQKGRSALVEKAVKATQLYFGCSGLARVHDQQRLYTRMQKAINRVAAHYQMAEDDVARQVEDEAKRRGPVCPLPGKDI